MSVRPWAGLANIVVVAPLALLLIVATVLLAKLYCWKLFVLLSVMAVVGVVPTGGPTLRKVYGAAAGELNVNALEGTVSVTGDETLENVIGTLLCDESL